MVLVKQAHHAIDARPSPINPGRPRRSALLIAFAVGGACVVGFAVSPPGRAFGRAAFDFLAFYSGVFSLVALSLTVMGGLAATDRILLTPKHRILLQMVHRSFATAAIVFLFVHILTKIAQGHAGVVDVIIPFLADHQVFYIGLGTIASYLMIVLAITGIRRARFAGTKRPWLWRSIHVTAYACWPIALLHGLNAGRAAKSWVTVSYILCLIFVGLGLLIRWWFTRGTRLATQRTRTIAVGYPSRRAASTARAAMSGAVAVELSVSVPTSGPAVPVGVGAATASSAAGAPPARPAKPPSSRRPTLPPPSPEPEPQWSAPSWTGRIPTQPPAAPPPPLGPRRSGQTPSMPTTGSIPRVPPQQARPETPAPKPQPVRRRQPAVNLHPMPLPPQQTTNPPAPSGPTPKSAPPKSSPRATGRWTNGDAETITDEEFWKYLRRELLDGDE